MASFKFTPLALAEVYLIEPQEFRDERGAFQELWRANVFQEAGIPALVQENYSRSLYGVLRGLHYQLQPRALGKLVRCTAGKIFDVAVDIRRKSPTFGQWVSRELEAEKGEMLWIPPGFAHGFCVLSPLAEVVYKMSDYYEPLYDRNIYWADATLNITWPVTSPILSPKDAGAPLLQNADNNF